VVELKVHPQGPSGVVFTAQGLNTDVRCKITLPVAWRPSVHVPAADMHTRRKLAKFGLDAEYDMRAKLELASSEALGVGCHGKCSMSFRQVEDVSA
jgi:hypothetical protein